MEQKIGVYTFDDESRYEFKIENDKYVHRYIYPPKEETVAEFREKLKPAIKHFIAINILTLEEFDKFINSNGFYEDVSWLS